MAGYQDRMANDFARVYGGECVLKGVFHRGKNKRVVIPALEPESSGEASFSGFRIRHVGLDPVPG